MCSTVWSPHDSNLLYVYICLKDLLKLFRDENGKVCEVNVCTYMNMS